MKRPHRVILGSIVLTAFAFGSTSEAKAQRLLQRLRERISVQLQNQQPPAAGDKDKNPDAKEDAAGQPTVAPLSRLQPNPASQYRNQPGGGVRSDGRDLEQSGEPAMAPAVTPQSAERSPANGGFGASVLQPLEPVDTDQQKASIGISGADGRIGRYSGIQVTSILPHSEAARAGLREGDFIFMINQASTPTIADLAKELVRYSPGDQVTLRIGQAGVVKDIDVVLVSRSGKPAATQPLDLNAPQVGMEINNPPSAVVNPQQQDRQQAKASVSVLTSLGAEVASAGRQRGVVVTSLLPGQIGAASGLKVNDRIISINGRMVADQAALQQQIVSLEKAYELGVIRNDDLVQVAIDQSQSNTASGDTASGNSASDASTGKSILGGFGSMFGGFGAGAATEPSKIPAKADFDELPSPKEVDVLSLEQDFPEPVKVTENSDKETAGKTEIQSEIDRLNERLRELKSKLDSDQ
ncbi:PDZ domain-containing protein [Stieleria sp. JC731]|uniref:PDZ domain-containing protein n=1 Tax=Pirellulaceae TaxID=2691357 RepID=UPI001E46A2A4|nr:PDZ domain-containing protein [Stieleria sp. JC731]MCC9600081.1 PDZ domain-containing protein [Stieleria sp. JC731]